MVLVIMLGVPYAILKYQSGKSGMTIREVVQRKMIRNDGSESGNLPVSTVSEGEKKDFLVRRHIGLDYDTKPMISHVLAEDLDQDGLMDVIVCDALDNFVSWIRQYPADTYTETVLASDLIAPVHAQAIDFDGDKDLLVAVLGLLYPSNDKIGSIVYLENDGDFHFKKHTIIERIARVSDIRAGDLDLFAVSAFNLWENPEAQSFIWLENVGDMEYVRRDIASDPTHLMVMQSGDFNQDGLVDFVTGGMYPYPPFDRMSRVTLWINDSSLLSEK
ncbi:MAG: VCBS repeat-containing protein [Bacteroidales bacterium]|nr:VCBS repeat-containing protein [Bacteroidales bacterium]